MPLLPLDQPRYKLNQVDAVAGRLRAVAELVILRTALSAALIAIGGNRSVGRNLVFYDVPLKSSGCAYRWAEPGNGLWKP